MLLLLLLGLNKLAVPCHGSTSVSWNSLMLKLADHPISPKSFQNKHTVNSLILHSWWHRQLCIRCKRSCALAFVQSFVVVPPSESVATKSRQRVQSKVLSKKRHSQWWALVRHATTLPTRQERSNSSPIPHSSTLRHCPNCANLARYISNSTVCNGVGVLKIVGWLIYAHRQGWG